MPTTRKQPFTGRGAGAKQPSGTYRKPKGPEKAGPGLRELEQLAGKAHTEEERRVEEIVGYLKEGAAKFDRQTAVKRVADALSPENVAKGKAAVEAAHAAMMNPRPLPKRKKEAYAPHWNYRVVRRYSKYGSWLEITEVHYAKGKPVMFATGGNMMNAVVRDDIVDLDVAGAVHVLRDKVSQLFTALDQPILDEKTDFGRVSDSAT